MARDKRIRVYEDEVQLLKKVREEAVMFNGEEPLGEVAAQLAKNTLTNPYPRDDVHALSHREEDDGR